MDSYIGARTGIEGRPGNGMVVGDFLHQAIDANSRNKFAVPGHDFSRAASGLTPVGFSRCHPLPQGLKALAILGALGSGTPEGVP